MGVGQSRGDHAPSVRGTSSASSLLSWTSRLELDPCVPPGWFGYEITYRHRSAQGVPRLLRGSPACRCNSKAPKHTACPIRVSSSMPSVGL